ncbi:hypothetical protein EJ08DRAFT_698774 [Tothia fuscella]|uniref:MARVEL domain-containing protein n=1 Tax=Tothia fuscella TaxID=1048955 RepID=A0A9P4NP86_9PEZI|nr:hypothetical protein EJ08DRAFT_698774 [Tothia fuscella]
MAPTYDHTSRYANHNARLYLRIAATITLFIALILDSIAAGTCNRRRPFYYEDEYLHCTSATGLSAASVALVWNIAEFITVKVNKKGIHPGAHIAIDLCLVAWLATAATFDLATNVGEVNSINKPMAAAGGFESFAGLLHFILFVLACVGVHKWIQYSPKEASRLVRVLRKMEAKTVEAPPMPPVGPVKLIRLPDSDAGLPRMLVFYVTE